MNPGTTPTILVVEDNPEDAALLHLTLHEVAQLHIHTISDCTAALSYLSGTEPYDNRDEFPFPSLVVLDMHLPGHSGPRILKWIRENNTFAPLLLIILTKSPLGRTPGKIVERQGAATITFAPFMKIDSNEMATMIIDLYQKWLNGEL